jgi:hypothetical protein
MRRNIYIGILLILATCFSSCDDGFTEMNKSPNDLTGNVNVDNVFFNVMRTISYNYDFQLMGNCAQLYSETYPGSLGKYLKGSAEGIWTGFYGTLKTINILIERTDKGGDAENVLKNSLAKIFKVMQMQRATDLFGDMPYFDAGKGTEVYQPKFDSQESIYKDFIKLLDEAIDAIGDKTAIILSKDYENVYEGNPQKWKIFANSLKLRIANRIRYADADFAKTVIQKTLKSPVISSNSDNWTCYFMDEQYSKSPYHDEVAPYSVGNYPAYGFVKFLKDNEDPRLPQLVSPVYGGDDKPLLLNGKEQFNGMPEGINVQRPSFRCEHAIRVMSDPKYPTTLLSYSEVCFIKAELANENIISGVDANEEYRKGIKADMEYNKVHADSITKYLATSPAANLNGQTEDKLEQIIKQKWVSLFYNGHEAYAELRRTGYPKVVDRTPTVEVEMLKSNGLGVEIVTVPMWIGETNGKLPRRMEYPLTEFDLNPNADKKYAKVGLLDKLWWDAKK